LDPDFERILVMSAHIANQNFHFQLPSLSYIDARWEEPNLRTAADDIAPKPGPVARLVARLRAWQRDRQAMADFASMTDYELADIGLSRSDMHRVFNPALNADLRFRGTPA
jgi:uncharacterized protein YjiS (DUF1127 family)